jgi:sec-independent protein translocase protein TatB
MNMAGRWAGKARNMANEFKKSFDDMARQSELDELRAEVERLKTHDPIAGLNDDIERALNPVDTAAAEARAAAEAPLQPELPMQEEAPPPRSGEYQVSETPSGEPHPETAQP